MTTQADPTPAVAAGTVKIDPEGMARFGHDLHSQFRRYESDRRLAELKWERNARQFLGIYDPDIEKNIDKNRSQAYPKLTRWKCVSMLSRLMNLLFQAGDKNWTVAASAVPNLETTDLQTVLDKVMADQQQAQGGGMTGQPQIPDDEVIESAIREFAKKRADRMELEIEDQLQELGGTHLIDYVALCRKVLMSGIQYGAGVLKGPFTREEQLRKWEMSAQGQLTAVPYTAYRPCFEWVSLWDYYPDMSAKTIGQMDGQYERVVMSKHQVIELKKRPDFFKAQIDAFLRDRPTGNYKRRAFETELRAMGVQLNTAETGVTNKFEALVWTGHVSGAQLAACGVEVPDDKLTEDVRAIVWIMENYVIKAQIDPWSDLDEGETVRMYHHFIFEEDESFLMGNGLPAIMRDSQLGVCAATRMALDNGAVQRVFEVNNALLRIDSDITTINPDMVIQRDDDNPATAQYPAVRVIELPMNIDKMQGLARMFQEFADQETFVNAATGGDMQKGPSEPFRTATGASMLRGDAALPFKDVVRNFDIFTESVIASLLVFNKNLNPNPAIRGDFKPVARGATSLIAKEVLGMQLDNFATTLTDEEKQYVNMRNLARARVRVRDLEVEDLVYDDEKCDQIDQNAQAQQQQTQQQQQQMTEATIRQILAAALKDLSQAGKNSAAAEATTANVILDALQKGLNPDQVSPHAMMGAQDGSTQGGDSAESAGGAGASPAGGGMGENSPSASAGAGPMGSASALAAAADPVGQFAAAMPAGPSAGGAGAGAAV